MIRQEKLSVDTVHYMLKQNQDRQQVSFYAPDEFAGFRELVDEGAVLFTYYDENREMKGCVIADPVEDNKTVELTGPYGSTEVRIALIDEVKKHFPEYSLLLFVSDRNELSKMYEKHSDECSMELKCEAVEYTEVERYDAAKDDLKLHDRLFPSTYMNADSLATSEDTILVHKEAGEVVGYIAFNSEEAYIDYMGVAPEYRRRGIAGNLLAAALTEMKGSVVRLTVSDDNEPAKELYKKYGFRIVQHMVALKVN